ncbi:hypothetical protein A2U01_0027474, partial [Trifolium medium]|nr:hypothetical protein [Trifolium medium]
DVLKKEKESYNSEEKNDKGKRPFVASVIGGWMNQYTDLSSENEDFPRERRRRQSRTVEQWPTTSIVGGMPPPRGPSKGTLKRKIANMFSVNTGMSSQRKHSDRPVLGFSDDEYVGGTPNEIFLVIIMATMVNHNVSKVLIDEGSSCDIMYEELFTKLGLKRNNLTPYTETDLQGFNGSTTRPWGFMETHVTLWNGKDKSTRRQ